MRSLAGIVVLLLAFMSSVPAQAQEERILSFDSVIRVDLDGDVTVTEEVTVVALGQDIKRGIYRELPLPAAGQDNDVTAGIEVLEVLRNGEPEPWFTESGPNSIRIYMGQKDVFLEPGEYTYSLTYREAGQIRSFPDYDELYWNVTGNGWEFTIEKASATVILPRGAAVLNGTAYTGFAGERGDAWQRHEDSLGNTVFRTTGKLASGQGLTIAVSWRKAL